MSNIHLQPSHLPCLTISWLLCHKNYIKQYDNDFLFHNNE